MESGGDGRVLRLPGGILKLHHTYFKANSRSFIQLPGSIDVIGLDQYIFLENSKEKIYVRPTQ
jgi:hypothetical protein